ncbi:MAG TPA: helix-turn-helix domain-containing protein [Acidobacteriaceae bacterium]|jgi:DNA-binding MarR family transcriptional regulator|nr:helix-turn-helix domain-containing protein [Acidobacteriaceae bacterium]
MQKKVKTRGFAELIPLLVADVYQLAGAFRQWGDGIAGEVGQTQARWQVLSAASVGGRTVAQLARRLGYARQSVQRTADLLVTDGLAKYASNMDHRKSPHLELTQHGDDALKTLTAAAGQEHKKLAAAASAAGVNTTELQTALDVIRQMCAAMETKGFATRP